jgi:hypothetical protein
VFPGAHLVGDAVAQPHQELVADGMQVAVELPLDLVEIDALQHAGDEGRPLGTLDLAGAAVQVFQADRLLAALGIDADHRMTQPAPDLQGDAGHRFAEGEQEGAWILRRARAEAGITAALWFDHKRSSPQQKKEREL